MNDLMNQQTTGAVEETGAKTPAKQDSAQIDFVLLDASGSMYDKWKESTEAIDNYVNELRYSEVNTKVTMATFTTYGTALAFNIVRDTKPETWTRVAYDETITTSGSTPLYDAINAMMTHLRDQNPVKCSIVIVTDGEENGSKTTVEQAKALLSWGRRRGWQITFIGCDFENSRQAKMLGANDSNSIGLDKKRLSDATTLMAKKRQYYSEYGTTMDFSEGEKKDLGGFLPDHSKK